MTDKDLVIIGEDCILKSFIEGNLIQLNFEVSPNLNSVVFCSCEYNLFVQINIQRDNVAFMIEGVIIYQSIKLIIGRIKLHNFEEAIVQNNSQSIFKTFDKVETRSQEEGPETDGFLVIELDESHVFLAAYGH